MDSVSEARASFEFGRFRILPRRREVLADGRQMELGGRAFDVLVALVEANGAVVSKDELMSRAWPGRIVEDNNLHAQVKALRKAFSDHDLIRTVVGRGYQFTGEIRALPAGQNTQTEPETASDVSSPRRVPTNLPAPTSDLIGRGDEIEEVIGLVADHRFVTLTGTGGIGKTRLAVEVARHRLPQFADGVWITELASLSDPQLVPITVAVASGLELVSGVVSPERIAAALSSKQIMLVLDNCEHVIDAAAGMVEALLHANPAARVIATSREPLRAESEHLYRVPPLAVPAEDTQALEDVLRHGAVALFVARVQEADPHFAPDQQTVAAIAAICRRLDGIPLALELAAARASTLGMQELASRLDDCFSLLTEGRRTALRRHQTLRATLDWSYELLSESERKVLRQLSIFAGGFTLAAAGAVISNADMLASDVVDDVANLVAKSLVTADVVGAAVHCRLLETTRAYAREKLAEHGELEQAARRHAEYYKDLCGQAEAEWQTRPTAEWLTDYGRQIGNVRTALDWAFSPRGEASIGMALTAAAVPLWCQLSLLDECRRRVEQALSRVALGSGRDTNREMQLEAALGLALFHTKGATGETGAAWTRALAIADRLKNTEYRLRALWGLWSYRMNCGEFRAALAFAQRFHRLAGKQPDPADRLIADRMIGTVLRFMGDLSNARRRIERMLDRYVDPLLRSHAIRFVWDQRVAGEMVLAVILWLQGFPDQAMRTARRTIESVQARDHTISLCYALSTAACPIALRVGDLAAAERYVSMLLDHSAKLAMAVWQAEGRCLKGGLLLKRGRVEDGLALLRTALGELRETGSVLRYGAFLGVLAEGLAAAGQAGAGRATVDEALALSESNEEGWCVAELLRIKGELVLLENAPHAAAAAEDHFRQALDWARRQGALSWELRAATSFARMWRNQGRSKEARGLLAPVYHRFTEGFKTADLNAAKALLDCLH
ncbi:MAG: winged helix-turn-helix domain-containing protein [Alphaproteobacteria bacterium]|nr:winged helix-turn-helix domain-containing protein [Alphaproteobacteria bacterium]